MTDALVPELARGAWIDPTGVYRYGLWRGWDVGKRVVFVGLNPSTADALVDDQTIRKCTAYTKRWGCTQFYMSNLFALRATDPSELLKAKDPVGPENDKALVLIFNTARAAGDLVVCCWGRGPGRSDIVEKRVRRVREMMKEAGVRPWVFGLTANMQPLHPLYLPGDKELLKWAL